ncbi:MAG: hypothetical protein NE334_01565 [Lentisphaeraceae bacterium]|nr:hypothetical protein [Lentisphaeraceae bacterium]
MQFDVRKAIWGQDSSYAIEEKPPLHITREKYVYRQGLLDACNLLADNLIEGFICHEQYLIEKKKWQRPKGYIKP